MLLRSAQVGHDINLYNGRVLLGRRKDCDIVLESKLASVSRQHAELRVSDNLVEVRDLDSHNGTLLAGQRLEPFRWYRIETGARFQICDFHFQLINSSDLSSVSDSKIQTSTRDNNESLKLSASRTVSPSSPDKLTSFMGQLRGVFEIAKSLRNVLEIDHILAKTAESLLLIFPRAQLVAIGLLSPDGNFQQEQVRRRSKSSTSDVILSHTVVNHVLKSGEAVLFADAPNELDEPQSVLSANALAVLAAPFVNSEGQIVGLIYVDSPLTNDFGEDDLELLVSVSSMITMAYNFSVLHKAAMRDAVVRRDVENARVVQQSYLPEGTPSITNYQLAAFYRAARHIGGDYYDFIQLADGKLAIVLGDVAGKGVPAALTMVKLATETRACFETLTSPAAIIGRLNQRFANSYITILVAILDPATHTVTIANAGHEYPMLIDNSGKLTEIGDDFSGLPLSVSDSEVYSDVTLTIAPGTSLTIFSDGFPDAESVGGHRFGKQRIGPLLIRSSRQSRELIEQVVTEVDQFIGDHPQFDDMCLVHLRRI